MIRRRNLIAMLGGATLGQPLAAFAENGAGLPLVAVLWPSTRELEIDQDAALRRGLKDAGFVDGVINMKTAKALGLALPREMLLRATDVIE